MRPNSGRVNGRAVNSFDCCIDCKPSLSMSATSAVQIPDTDSAQKLHFIYFPITNHRYNQNTNSYLRRGSYLWNILKRLGIKQHRSGNEALLRQSCRFYWKQLLPKHLAIPPFQQEFLPRQTGWRGCCIATLPQLWKRPSAPPSKPSSPGDRQRWKLEGRADRGYPQKSSKSGISEDLKGLVFCLNH